jgi:hypothetical protein
MYPKRNLSDGRHYRFSGFCNHVGRPSESLDESTNPFGFVATSEVGAVQSQKMEVMSEVG